jgi:hypothetical protein
VCEKVLGYRFRLAFKETAMEYRIRKKLAVVIQVVLCGVAAVSVLGYARQDWPDLEVLQDYPSANKTCGLNGAAAIGTEKAKSNALKNRYKLPETGWEGFDKIAMKQILELPPYYGEPAATSEHEGNAKAVYLEGYVKDVFAGGRGESCNCKAEPSKLRDAHIDVVFKRNLGEGRDKAGRYKIVVEVTERGRRLAKMGKLRTNIGNDWSTTKLRSKLLGKRVRFYGWRFYDPDHHDGSWKVDPFDEMGEKNWRGTAWEVHPVMGIETLD